LALRGRNPLSGAAFRFPPVYSSTFLLAGPHVRRSSTPREERLLRRFPLLEIDGLAESEREAQALLVAAFVEVIPVR